METVASPSDSSTMATVGPYSSFEIKVHTITFSTPSQNLEARSALPSSSTVSTAESTVSPGSSLPDCQLSISSSVSVDSFHSLTPEKSKIDNKKLSYYTDACLQCTTLGLRCSLPRQALLREEFRSKTFCRRCEMRGEHLCILRNADSGQYCADGADECEVKKRAEELLVPKRERWKWCMPKIPPGTRAGLRQVWPRFSET